jgi:hypothetical protein
LIGVSSGIRIGTILSLTWGEIDLASYSDIGKIIVRKSKGRKITKGKFYVTWIDKEAIEALQQWRSYLEKKGKAVRNEDRIFNMSQDAFTDSWILALGKAGLDERKRRNHELHFHTVRKYFRTQCEISGVPRSFWDFWMGHSGGYLDEAYFRAAELEHVAQYRKAVPSLSLETQPESFKQELVKMEDRSRLEREALLSRIATLEKQFKEAEEIRKGTEDALVNEVEKRLRAKREQDLQEEMDEQYSSSKEEN